MSLSTRTEKYQSLKSAFMRPRARRGWVPDSPAPECFAQRHVLEHEMIRVSSDDREHLTCVHEQMVSHKRLVKPINLDNIIIVLVIIHHLVVPELFLF
jgi:hypothetical protein